MWRWFGTFLRIGLAVVWAFAGWSKVTDPAATVRAVRAYRLLPEALVHPFAYALPFVELTIALLLLVGIGVRVTATVSALLLVVFIGSVVSADARGLTIDCGCFGGGGQVAAGQTRYGAEIMRDLLFLAASVWLVVRPVTRLAFDPFALPVEEPEQELVS